MATLGQTIHSWLDLNRFPPAYTDLPDSITIEDGILNGIVGALNTSVMAQKERGGGIGYWDERAALELGVIEEGEEASIATTSTKTPLWSTPVGSFHTHPNVNAFSAPSPADVWALMASSRDVFELVAAVGWFYLLIRTADTISPPNSLEGKDRFAIIDKYIQGTAGTAMSQVEMQIRFEMTQQGIPTSVPIDPSIPKQLGYDRGLSQALGKLKVGFYSATSPVLLRRGG